MKRFYCTICKRVKRVQNLPLGVENPSAGSPDARIGQCRWHSGNTPRVPVRVRPERRVKAVAMPVKNNRRKAS